VATQQDAQALLMLASPLVGGNPKPLAELALRHHLPAITVFTEFARHGGLMAYGPNLQSVVRQQGLLAARVLLGSKPAETPIETPAKFEFVVNFKTAGQLGITVPASILLRADEVVAAP